MDIIRKTARLFKDDLVGVLTISFLWASILFLTVVLGRTVGYGLGFYIFLVIPATISMRFVYYTYTMGKPISYGSFKIGFVTIISSIKCKKRKYFSCSFYSRCIYIIKINIFFFFVHLFHLPILRIPFILLKSKFYKRIIIVFMLYLHKKPTIGLL